MNEYYPMEKTNIYSTHKIMHNKFFSKVDFDEENLHFLEGTTKVDGIRAYCDKFEKEIKNLGGIDVQI